MLRTLRNRLVFSHLLPILIVIPLMGIVVIYTLETQILLPRFAKELTVEANLLAEILSDQPEIWSDPDLAQYVLTQAQPILAARVMLLSPEGQLLASTDPEDADRMGNLLDVPDFQDAFAGSVVSYTNFSQRLRGEIVDVYAPVAGYNDQQVGIVRLSYRFTTVYEDFLQMRYLIIAILGISLLASVLLGSSLALNINAPLQKAIGAVHDLARGTGNVPLTEEGAQEIRLLLRSVNHLMDRLHSLEEARQRLLANLVHEIGRPLGALHAAVQALLRNPQIDPQLLEEMLRGMNDETSRLQKLLDELANLHDQVLGTMELNREQINLGEWLPGVLAPWKAAAQEKRLRWEASFPEKLPGVDADPLRLAQAVGNLLSNAIKYTSAGGKITVTAGSTTDTTWITVGDTGPGIPTDELEKIFTPFYHAQHTKRITQGMGLGLSIARDLIEAHEGKLEVQSQPGIGSQFTIRLPILKSTTPSE